MGAIDKISRAKEASEAEDQLRVTLRLRHDHDGIADFNDSHTHAEVLQLFDDTIARLEAKP